MSQRSEALNDRFEAFNNEMIEFAESCPDDVWGQVVEDEGRPVGVMVHHVASGHYGGSLQFSQMVVAGEPLPNLTWEMIHSSNTDHAAEHAGVTKEESLGVMRENAAALSSFITGLDDAALDRRANSEAFGGEIGVEAIVDMIIVSSGGGHLEKMKAVAG